MTRQFQHSTNVECGLIMRNSTVFEFELRHIPSHLLLADHMDTLEASPFHGIALYRHLLAFLLN